MLNKYEQYFLFTFEWLWVQFSDIGLAQCAQVLNFIHIGQSYWPFYLSII